MAVRRNKQLLPRLRPARPCLFLAGCSHPEPALRRLHPWSAALLLLSRRPSPSSFAAAATCSPLCCSASRHLPARPTLRLRPKRRGPVDLLLRWEPPSPSCCTFSIALAACLPLLLRGNSRGHGVWFSREQQQADRQVPPRTLRTLSPAPRSMVRVGTAKLPPGRIWGILESAAVTLSSCGRMT